MRIFALGALALLFAACGDADSLGLNDQNVRRADGGPDEDAGSEEGAGGDSAGSAGGATGGRASAGGRAGAGGRDASGGESSAGGRPAAGGRASAGGASTGGTPGAGGGDAEPDPCVGKVCGDECTPTCPPAEPNCDVLTVVSYCNSRGECQSSVPACDYDPCDGKRCGDTCRLCPPNDPTCVETADIKACNSRGQCVSGSPQCSDAQCDDASDCPRSLAPCRQCPDGSFACPESECVEGQCVVNFGECRDVPVECKQASDCATIDACRVCADGSFSCAVADCVSGQCVTRFPACSGGQACVVEGKRYASGSTAVPDPYSCNTCVCRNGRLTDCTEKACDEPCPAGTSPGTRCAACGPAGGCQATEIGCLPACTADSFVAACGIGELCLDGHCALACL